MAWFADALLVNTPAEASHPDPLKAASSEFLMNVSVAMLELAMPIVRDESKFNKASLHVRSLKVACCGRIVTISAGTPQAYQSCLNGEEDLIVTASYLPCRAR